MGPWRQIMGLDLLDLRRQIQSLSFAQTVLEWTIRTSPPNIVTG